MEHRIAIIGAGHMGGAIILGLAANAPSLEIMPVETDEDRRRAVWDKFGIEARPRYEPGSADAIVLAIQPQQFGAFASQYEYGVFKDALIMSVMAGVSTGVMTKLLGTDRVVRAIPNTPSEVGEGMTVLTPGPAVTQADLELAEQLLGSIGRVLTVRDEALIDDATALCGGGPAFVAHIAEAFAEFAVLAGFLPAEAQLMVCQVLRGTATLLEVSGRGPQTLCNEVMTPNGTTERGIFYFRDTGLRGILTEGLRRAADRSRELGGIARLVRSVTGSARADPITEGGTQRAGSNAASRRQSCGPGGDRGLL